MSHRLFHHSFLSNTRVWDSHAGRCGRGGGPSGRCPALQSLPCGVPAPGAAAVALVHHAGKSGTTRPATVARTLQGMVRVGRVERAPEGGYRIAAEARHRRGLLPGNVTASNPQAGRVTVTGNSRRRPGDRPSDTAARDHGAAPLRGGSDIEANGHGPRPRSSTLDPPPATVPTNAVTSRAGRAPSGSPTPNGRWLNRPPPGRA
jgi:hypothetical protein